MSIFKRLKRLFRSFQYAWQGITFLFKSERNMRIHLLFALVALLLSYVLDIPKVEFLLVLIAIFLVLGLEMMNTAIETTLDLITTDFHPLAKIAKDVAAGAVLCVSVCALFIGIYVFLPPLLTIINHIWLK